MAVVGIGLTLIHFRPLAAQNAECEKLSVWMHGNVSTDGIASGCSQAHITLTHFGGQGFDDQGIWCQTLYGRDVRVRRNGLRSKLKISELTVGADAFRV